MVLFQSEQKSVPKNDTNGTKNVTKRYKKGVPRNDAKKSNKKCPKNRPQRVLKKVSEKSETDQGRLPGG